MVMKRWSYDVTIRFAVSFRRLQRPVDTGEQALFPL